MEHLATHGISGYVSGCRCETCRDGNRDYHRAYREKNRDKRRAYNRQYNKEWRARRQKQIRETHENKGLLPGKERKEIKRIEIFERDGWVCHICGKDIDPALKHPDAWSASVDHVVSLANGGTHTRDNMAASHLQCNLRKK